MRDVEPYSELELHMARDELTLIELASTIVEYLLGAKAMLSLCQRTVAGFSKDRFEKVFEFICRRASCTVGSRDSTFNEQVRLTI